MCTTSRLRLGAAAGLAALTLTAAPAAYADSVIVLDPADSTTSPYDIRTVEAVHTTPRLVARVSVTDLDIEGDAGPASMSLFVDTDKDAKGPELRLATGLNNGSDYQLVRMEDWQPVGDALTCRHAVRLDAARGVVRFRISGACLGHPDSVRVGVLMVDHHGAGQPVRDWLKGFRRWTSWVAAG